jgi:hypothetical protein
MTPEQYEQVIEWGRWILGLILSSGVTVFIIKKFTEQSDRARNYDRETMEKIKTDLSTVIAYIRPRDFGTIFSNDIFMQFDRFFIHSTEPDYKFSQKKLENKRKELEKALHEFSGHLAINSFPLNNPNLSKIFPEAHENRDKFTELRIKLNKMNEKVCAHYDELAEIAKKEL